MRAFGIVRGLAFGELRAFLHEEIVHLPARRDVDRVILAVMPGAGGVIAGRVRGDQILHLLVGELADRRQDLIAGLEIGVEHQDAVGRDEEGRVRGAAVVDHGVDVVGVLCWTMVSAFASQRMQPSPGRRKGNDELSWKSPPKCVFLLAGSVGEGAAAGKGPAPRKIAKSPRNFPVVSPPERPSMLDFPGGGRYTMPGPAPHRAARFLFRVPPLRPHRLEA